MSLIFEKGILCYQNPEISDIQQYVQDNLSLLWEEYKRISKPEEYPVDLSEDCWSNKMQRIHEVKSRIEEEARKNKEKLAFRSRRASFLYVYIIFHV